MRKVLTVRIVVGAFIGWMIVAHPAAGFEPTSGLLTDHEKMLKYKDQQAAQPYAMNYADEAAQTLDVYDGRWNLVDARHSRSELMPNVSGGIDGGRPMLKLQWRVGQ